VDSSGSLFVADSGNHVIRKISPTGEVTVFAGSPGESGWSDGHASDAKFNIPWGMAIDSFGNLFVTDAYNQVIRKVNASGYVTTIAGVPQEYGANDGEAVSAKFENPIGITIGAAGNLFVSDRDRIRMVFMGTAI
jgi:hypothetical protein